MQDLIKVCSKCKIEKGVNEFYKNKSRKGGVQYHCKVCSNENIEKYRKKNPNKEKEARMIWRGKNPDKGKEAQSRWRKNNPEKVKELSTMQRKKNPEKIKELNTRYTNELSDSYVRGTLKATLFPQELINNPEMIEVKRLIIKTQRLCRTSQN